MKFVRILIFTFLLLLGQCARIGSPTGGEKDEIPPMVVKTYPPSGSVNFKGNRIDLIFNEFVTIKDAQKQLIISPPMKIFPEISPLSNASKRISIRIIDTLLPNTTYAFNFGNSIKDYNEGNTLPFYKFLFSTGQNIDSLSVKGQIFDAIHKKTDNFVNVALYEINEKFTDSIIYKEPPRYITNTLDSLKTFEISNVKEGKYLLIAMKDKINNYLFDPKDDKIAFYQSFINIPSDTIYDLHLFKEEKENKVYRPFQSAEKRISIGYDGNRDSLKISTLPPYPTDFKYFVSKENDKDTLNFWFSPKIEDSLKLLVHNTKIDTFTINFRKMKADSLQIKSETKSISPSLEKIIISSNIPIIKFNEKGIKIEKDSINIPAKFEMNKDSLTLTIDVATQEKSQYKMTILPQTFTDFYGTTNDTIKVNFSSKSVEDFATFKLNINKKIQFPILIELTNNQGNKVEYQQFFEQKQKEYAFHFIKPNKYFVRIIEDKNSNKKWDTGNFLKRISPEKVYHLEKEIDLRANWEVIEEF